LAKYARAARFTLGASKILDKIVGIAIKPKAISRKLIISEIVAVAEITIVTR
jgi:hypothetical protein